MPSVSVVISTHNYAAQRFRFEDMVRAYEEVYESLANGRGQPADAARLGYYSNI